LCGRGQSHLIPAGRKIDSLADGRPAGILLILRAAATPTLRAYQFIVNADWYHFIDFARSRHTNPTRIPVIVNADWYHFKVATVEWAAWRWVRCTSEPVLSSSIFSTEAGGGPLRAAENGALRGDDALQAGGIAWTFINSPMVSASPCRMREPNPAVQARLGDVLRSRVR
jgi:hypothetical protein